MKDNLVSLYEFYLKVDEVEDDNKKKHDDDVINDNDMEVLILWLDSKDIYKIKIMWKIEIRLRDIWLMGVRIFMMIN